MTLLTLKVRFKRKRTHPGKNQPAGLSCTCYMQRFQDAERWHSLEQGTNSAGRELDTFYDDRSCVQIVHRYLRCEISLPLKQVIEEKIQPLKGKESIFYRNPIRDRQKQHTIAGKVTGNLTTSRGQHHNLHNLHHLGSILGYSPVLEGAYSVT